MKWYLNIACTIVAMLLLIACEDIDNDVDENEVPVTEDLEAMDDEVGDDPLGGIDDDDEINDDDLGTIGDRMDDDEASDAREVTITTTDFEFVPAEIIATPGERLMVRLVNDGEAPHNIEFELPDGEEMLELAVPAGESDSLTITAPDEPGQYVFYCPVADHRDHGMEGRLIVEEE